MEAEWDNIGRPYYQIPFSSATDIVAAAAKKMHPKTLER